MRVINKRARFNYRLIDELETGISLTGKEVKAVRAGLVDLTSAHGKILRGEVYLVGAVINASRAQNYDPSRSRKLLLHKKEIVSLQNKMKQKKLTLVPTAMYTRGRLIKLKLALAKIKRKFEKKETIKKRDIEREIEKELRGRQ